jgi:hypothetical protein
VTATKATTLTNSKLECDLEHYRPRAATVRIEIKSTRATKPGHPVVRKAAICATHARQLRQMGLELVKAIESRPCPIRTPASR